MCSFESKIAQLRRVERGEIMYGDGDRETQAVRFFLDEMLGDAVQRALPRSSRPRDPVRLLISLAGFSPLTTILAYELLRPERLLVVTSEHAAASIDLIAGHVVASGRLRYRDFAPRSCSPTDPLAIYRIVKEALDEMRQPGTRRPYAIIDITGGRKVMSAAAALAAWQLGLDLCYIDSAYDAGSRRAVPGSDRLLLLDDPTSLFGEQAMDSALQTFASGAFEAAHRRYEELCDKIAQPRRARFMRDLSSLYRAWCDLDLAEIPAAVDAVEASLRLARSEICSEMADRIEGQVTFLRGLAAGDRNSLLACFYVLGLHYREVGRHDFAALLFYRTIEGCLTLRLAGRAAGFRCDQPRYALLIANVGGLRSRYGQIRASLGGNDPGVPLPPVVGLTDAAALLAALDDEIIPRAKLAGTKALSHLNNLAAVRNKSVLAHGDQTVSPAHSRTLERKARDVLEAYWAVEAVAGDIRALCQDLRFVRTDR